MSYYPNWERALVYSSITGVLAVGSWILHDTIGPTAVTTVFAVLFPGSWILILGIVFLHSAYSLRIENGVIVQTHFSFAGRRVALSELREVEMVRGVYPVTLRFERGEDMSVSGMVKDQLLSFLQETASEVRIIDSTDR